MRIYIAGSMFFAKEFVKTKEVLERMGFIADFAPDTYECINNPELNLNENLEHCERMDIMRACFEIQEKCDSLIVLNYKKEDLEGYIGVNSLIEMGLAYYLRQKIFLLYPPPNKEKARYYTEVMLMKPIILNGKLENIMNYLD